MAELQEKFTYDDDPLNALERSISLERLAPYSGLAQGNRKGCSLSVVSPNSGCGPINCISEPFEVGSAEVCSKSASLVIGIPRRLVDCPSPQFQRSEVRIALEIWDRRERRL